MWWSALDENNTAVGVMLFEGKEGDALELAYLGLVPSARGRGLSDALIPFADRIAAAADYRLLEVSVDARNRPAMKLYSRHGFVEYDRRAVWLAVWAA
jgi:ribosomal protein S18 acetylase RimI-like enzyme